MKKGLRIAVVTAASLITILGISTAQAGRKGIPLPPPPVLCGCACPDGSFVITHAPSADQCEAVCATACDNTM